MPDPPRSVVRVAWRATWVGAALAALPLGVVLATGLLPPTSQASCVAAFGVASLGVALGNLMLASAALPRGPLSAAATMRALLADLALQVVLGGGTSAALFLLRTKFLAPAAFALAFAASAVVMRIAGAGVLSRALKPAAAGQHTRRRT